MKQEDIFKQKVVAVSFKDSVTEDEYNNFQIAMWELFNGKRKPEPRKYYYYDSKTGETIESDDPPASITITLNRDSVE